MVVNEFWVLLLDVKIAKLRIRLKKDICRKKEDTNRGYNCNKEEWLEEFLDGKGAFCNGSESDDNDNDSDYENCNENTA